MDKENISETPFYKPIEGWKRSDPPFLVPLAPFINETDIDLRMGPLRDPNLSTSENLKLFNTSARLALLPKMK